MFAILRFLLIAAVSIVTAAGSAMADDAAFRALVDALAKGSLKDKAERIEALVATGDPRAVPVLNALAEGDLWVREADGRVFITRKSSSGYDLSDPVTGEPAGEAAKSALDKIKVNNKLRRLLRNAIGSLTLQSPNPALRLDAANAIFKSGDPDALPLLESAIAAEKEPHIRDAMERARAAAILRSDADETVKLAAIDTIAAIGSRDALDKLLEFAQGADGDTLQAARAAIVRVEKTLAYWTAVQNVWYGLSLGSVLLLAAIGLAITFGVMGVINMAHGEMVMLGAYTTFVVQGLVQSVAPGAFEYSLLVAVPAAFLVTAAFGLAIERGIIRFLYGRPLETLLATWGVSLILQQGVRSVFGPTNQEVTPPAWMTGAFELGGLTITANRLWIIVFALVVFAILLTVLKRTGFGLQMRAVTQNRSMASSMGIRTPWVDAFTFALGSGIAGIAGVALSQIDNVSPNLGQSYIVDSFMVVVFGGVGNLWGTLVGAMTLGVANKFLEPYAGAVLAKILLLVLIILFIQKRPRGLFALKGRAVDA